MLAAKSNCPLEDEGASVFLACAKCFEKNVCATFPVVAVGRAWCCNIFHGHAVQTSSRCFRNFRVLDPTERERLQYTHKNRTAPTDSKRSNRDQKRTKMTLTKLTCDIFLCEQKWIVQFLLPCFVQTINFSCEPIVVEIGKPLCVSKIQIHKKQNFLFYKNSCLRRSRNKSKIPL